MDPVADSAVNPAMWKSAMQPAMNSAMWKSAMQFVVRELLQATLRH
jgi:hypothetical protein